MLVIYYHKPLSLTAPNDVRAMHNIELSLRREAACTPHARYDKEKIENHVQDIRRILDTLHASGSPLRKGSSTDERVPHLTFIDSYNSATSFVSESGVSPAFTGILWNTDYSPALLSRLHHHSLRTFDQPHLCVTRAFLPYRSNLVQYGRKWRDSPPPYG